MKILYIGDIMAEAGIKTVEAILPGLRKELKADLVIAQAENVTEGRGLSVADMRHLRSIGIDFFTGGNWTPFLPELHPLLFNPQEPVIGPANMPSSPGPGWKFVSTPRGRVLVVSLLGSTVGREIETTNPLLAIDEILERNKDEERTATIVNFHGDYSSEKRIIGYYLDGKVTAVLGDHWHVPTADAMVLPKGTAHMTDVGMCGVLHSSLGVTLESVVPRWREGVQTKNVMADEKPYQFNAVLIESDDKTSLATSIEPINRLLK